VVNVLTDTGAGSGQTGDLRYCVTNATSGQDTITFAPGLSGTIRLQGALPTLNASVAIQGPGAGRMTVQGENPSYPYIQGFGICTVGSAASVQISGLTLAGADQAVINDGSVALNDCTLTNNDNGALSNSGSATVSNCTLSQTALGAAIGNGGTAIVNDSTLSQNDAGTIFNSGNLTVNYSTLSGNLFNGTYYGGGAVSNSASGGAIFNSGNLTVNNSTLSGNVVDGGNAYVTTSAAGATTNYPSGDGAGGGIYMQSGTLSINSSTLEGNRANGGAGTINARNQTGNGLGGGLYISGGTVSINNSTLAGNLATDLGSGSGLHDGGGIYNAAGPSALQMYDTILADNSADTAGPDLYGSVTSLGHNLIGNTSGGSGFAASDLLNVNPLLGSLQNNGGPTQTMALLAGSPAIDAGDNTNAPADDQRGPAFPRVVHGTIDIGAFEVQNSAQLSSLAVAGFPSVTKAGVPGSFTVTALNGAGTTDTGYTGTVVFTSTDVKATLPAAYTFTTADAGKHTFSATLFTAGTRSLTATDTTTNLSGTDGGITVDPAAASQLVVSGFPSPTTAGASHTFAVAAEDPYGNAASGYTGTVHFTSSDARATLPANYTFTAADAGRHTFSGTLKTAGTQSLTATDTTTASLTGTDGGIAVQPAAASKFVLTGPRGVSPGVPFSLTLTALDAYGNVVTGYTGTVHLSSSDGTATLPANYTFTASDQGVHTFTGLVLHRKGKQTVSVTDTQNSSLTASLTEQVA
jgi:hypothetical protein